ncbi:Ada metal-binding domain-containing protein [Falsigemmobacter faecalis]|uniref:Ada metal-binding domain-containing protein n=1 Tax=Falsigemmobacter faecalis TaxID=2488730 RepID=UPI0013151CAD|nr:Ada metal-binding domain-containing protein [Falsigemmobacter faecalis]
MSNENSRWLAIETCDGKAAGTFVYGRDSDKIYHSPICRTRPTNCDDLKFFDTPDGARQQGFRVCDDCYPDQAGWLVGASRWV